MVGGVCATLQGAPYTTFDLDILHSRTVVNIARLEAALEEMDAYYRHQPHRKIRPGPSHLRSAGHQLLTTRFCDLDVLGEIDDGRGYDEFLPETEAIDIEPGLTIRTLKLESLIEVKKRTGRNKDLAVLPLLRNTLNERQR